MLLIVIKIFWFLIFLFFNLKQWTLSCRILKSQSLFKILKLVETLRHRSNIISLDILVSFQEKVVLNIANQHLSGLFNIKLFVSLILKQTLVFFLINQNQYVTVIAFCYLFSFAINTSFLGVKMILFTLFQFFCAFFYVHLKTSQFNIY